MGCIFSGPNYSDQKAGWSPEKWGFRKGILPKMAENIQVKDLESIAQIFSRCWFEMLIILFIFTPTWGRFPF